MTLVPRIFTVDHTFKVSSYQRNHLHHHVKSKSLKPSTIQQECDMDRCLYMHIIVLTTAQGLRIIYNTNLYEFLVVNNILRPRQSVFRNSTCVYDKNDQPGSHDFQSFIGQYLTDFLEILQRPFSYKIRTAVEKSQKITKKSRISSMGS